MTARGISRCHCCCCHFCRCYSHLSFTGWLLRQCLRLSSSWLCLRLSTRNLGLFRPRCLLSNGTSPTVCLSFDGWLLRCLLLHASTLHHLSSRSCLMRPDDSDQSLLTFLSITLLPLLSTLSSIVRLPSSLLTSLSVAPLPLLSTSLFVATSLSSLSLLPVAPLQSLSMLSSVSPLPSLLSTLSSFAPPQSLSLLSPVMPPSPTRATTPTQGRRRRLHISNNNTIRMRATMPAQGPQDACALTMLANLGNHCCGQAHDK